MTSRRCFSYSRFLAWNLIVILGCTCAVNANTTSAVPGESSYSFESFTNLASVVGTNGWYSMVPESAIVTNDTYDFPLQRPLENATHTNYLVVSDSVTNLLDNSPYEDTNIWVDVMVCPVNSDTVPEIDEDIQVGMYFSNGYMRIFHRYYVNAGGNTEARWTTLDHDPIATGEWARVTMKFDYRTADYGGSDADKYFQVSINGGEAISNHYGAPVLFDGAPTGPPPWTNGTWFMVANGGGGAGADGINSVEIQGSGKIDDLVVTNDEVFAEVRWEIDTDIVGNGDIYPGGNDSVMVPDGDSVTFTITPDAGSAISDVEVDGVSSGEVSSITLHNVTNDHSLIATFVPAGSQYTDLETPYNWLDEYADLLSITITNYNTADLEDWDEDGALNWEEHVAGTYPNNSNSVFEVLEVMYMSDSNKVVWYGTTNFGMSTPNFSMYRSTNELSADDWDLIESNTLERADDGTNVYWDSTAPDGVPAFYQPTILWEVE